MTKALLFWRKLLPDADSLEHGVAEREHRIRCGDLDRLDHGHRRDRALDRRLFDRHTFGQLVIDQFLQRDRIQELDHLLVQAGPQIVRHAAAGFAHAVFFAAALGGIDGLVYR